MGDVENTIFDVWKSIYPSLADCILLLFCIAMFFWFRASIKNTMARFTEMIQANALTVKEHLDQYNMTHEKSWQALSDLVNELKEGKVWQNEYLLQIQNIKDKGEMRDERIKDIDERLKCVGRNRRAENHD